MYALRIIVWFDVALGYGMLSLFTAYTGFPYLVQNTVVIVFVEQKIFAKVTYTLYMIVVGLHNSNSYIFICLVSDPNHVDLKLFGMDCCLCCFLLLRECGVGRCQRFIDGGSHPVHMVCCM